MDSGQPGLWPVLPFRFFSLTATIITRSSPCYIRWGQRSWNPKTSPYPVRSILRKLRNVHFTMGEVDKVDLAAHVVETNGKEIPYDFLILATGSRPHFFDVPGAAEYAFPLRTLDEGVALRNRILSCFERAVYEPNAEKRQRLLTFSIVGGGPTGVEFSGALAELAYGPLKKDYPALDFRSVRVLLLEATSSLLPTLPERLRSYTLRRLNKMGVEVRLQSVVRQITPDGVYLKDGSVVLAETVVWTAGVQGDPLAKSWGLPTTRGGRVSVQPTLQVPGHPNTYVIGDLAYVEENGHPLPLVAPVAIQQGVAAAHNIARHISGASPRPFRYRDLGTMAVIGRNAAVAHLLGRWAFTGFPAWVTWLTVHLFKLIGFRNRLLVLTNWAWDYLFYERVVRLILPSLEAPSPKTNRRVYKGGASPDEEG